MGKLRVVVGGQFGSEAKGAVCGHLANRAVRDSVPLMAVRVAGPNAGHTVYDKTGYRWSFRHLPVAAVIDPNATLVIAAGSELDYGVLYDEIDRCEKAGISVLQRLVIDNSATVLLPIHAEMEQAVSLHERIGSTGKGIGAARAERAWRRAPVVHEMDNGSLHTADTATLINSWLRQGKEVHIEGTQGYGLGTHAGFYPQCTTSDCRAIDFLAMAGVSPWTAWADLEVWVVLRTYPIRVAGNSGPMHKELTWEEMARKVPGLEPERTTVTQKIRRVGEWDTSLALEALKANGHPSTNVRVAISFLDYLQPNLAGASSIHDVDEPTRGWVRSVGRTLGVNPSLLGTGPQTMIDCRDVAVGQDWVQEGMFA